MNRRPLLTDRLRRRAVSDAAPPSACRRDGGFTILEVLVVLAIISIAMAVAPSLLTSMNSIRLRAAAIELVGELREVHGSASRGQTRIDVTFDLRRLRLARSTAPEAFWALPAVVESVEVTPKRPGEPDDVARLQFLPDGSATAARISLQRGSLSATVVVNGLTGAVWRDG